MTITVTRPRLIGLTGPARAGKDSTGRVLAALGYQRFAFADNVREGLLRLNPLLPGGARLADVVTRIGWEEAKDHPVYGSEVGPLMQRFGTDTARALFGDDVWVDLLEQDIRTAGAGLVVVTDVRFDNEARWVRRAGGLIWRVHRTGGPGARARAGHPSESGVSSDLIDQVVRNDGTLPDLSLRVAAALDQVTSRDLAAA